MKIVMLGLSITSSWGNGHATTYRALVREVVARGHDVLFLERDVPWYAAQRDLAAPLYGRTELYTTVTDLQERFGADVRGADAVIVGSYVPEGVTVGSWVVQTAQGVTAFYDIDTPVTLDKLERGDDEYLSLDLIPRYDLYLSFAGGTVLDTLERRYHARRALPLYCSVDTTQYYPEDRAPLWDLGYLGTYSTDRQPPLDRLLVEPARQWGEGKFCVAGPQYPDTIGWPANVERIEHLPPSEHRAWYNAQRFTLNVTRAAMIKTGFSPSVRLFEAAACGVPLISDYWDGLETFFTLGQEILIASDTAEALRHLRAVPEEQRQEIGRRARARVLEEHTAAHRAAELEAYLTSALEWRTEPRARRRSR